MTVNNITYSGDASSDTTAAFIIAFTIAAFIIAAFIIAALINRDDLVGGWLVGDDMRCCCDRPLTWLLLYNKR